MAAIIFNRKKTTAANSKYHSIQNTMQKQAIYQPEGIYHVFNHAVGWDNLFITAGNYDYFIKKYVEKLNEVVDTLAYCLLPNHFHFVIRTKNEDQLLSFLERKKEKKPGLKIPNGLSKEELTHYIVHRQFHNFLGGYAKAFNKQFFRKGSLVRQNTRRKIVMEADYLINVIRYTNINIVLHQYVENIDEWPYTSYHQLLDDNPTWLCRKEILQWFGGRENFIRAHLDRINGELDFNFEK